VLQLHHVFVQSHDMARKQTIPFNICTNKSARTSTKKSTHPHPHIHTSTQFKQTTSIPTPVLPRIIFEKQKKKSALSKHTKMDGCVVWVRWAPPWYLGWYVGPELSLRCFRLLF
jgi:hypothetical protein